MLCGAANKPGEPIWVAGCMSGTSLDGVDVALLKTDGVRILGIGDTYFRPYSEAEQAMLRAELGNWEASAELAEMIETAHAEALSHLDGYDLIGFHGVTLAHDPKFARTFQAGSGAVLAEVMGKPVVWDFRSNDMNLGGQGAPLAPFFHQSIAKFSDAWEPVAFLNLGGVGNITWVDSMSDDPAGEGTLLAFDTGPANAPINDLMFERFGKAFDEDGTVAAKGTPSAAVMDDFIQHPYFFKVPPKSLDRNTFSGIMGQVRHLSDEDAVATATALCAASVARAMEHCREAPAMMLVCGGGRKNPTLMNMIKAGVDCAVEEIEALGLDGDFIEAQAFAHLAARVLYGLPTSAPGTTGVPSPVGGGQISRPETVEPPKPSVHHKSKVTIKAIEKPVLKPAVVNGDTSASDEDDGWDF